MDLLTALYGFAVTLEIIALMVAFLFLYNCSKRVRKHPETGYRLRRRKFMRDGFSFFSAVILGLSGIVPLQAAMFLQSYRAFVVGEPIAMITVTQSTPGSFFKAQIDELGTPVSSNQNALSKEFLIQGDRWSLEGNVIRFKSFFTFFGMKPVYQLTRIQGSYFSIEDERRKDRTIYTLIDRPAEEWWRWMYENGDSIPFVEIVHGSAVSQSAKVGSTYQISVLPTGFSLTPVEKTSP